MFRSFPAEGFEDFRAPELVGFVGEVEAVVGEFLFEFAVLVAHEGVEVDPGAAEFLGHLFEGGVEGGDGGVLFGVGSAGGEEGLDVDLEAGLAFTKLGEELAIPGFHLLDGASGVEVVDADENEEVGGGAVEHGFVEPLEDAAWIVRGHVVANDVGADAAIENAAAWEVFGDVEAFGDAVAQEDDVHEVLVLFGEGFDAILPVDLEQGGPIDRRFGSLPFRGWNGKGKGQGEGGGATGDEL